MKQMLDQIFCSHKHNNIDSSSDSVLNIPDIVLDSGLIVENIMDKRQLFLLKMLAEMDKWWNYRVKFMW